jgi:hypothetical protein
MAYILELVVFWRLVLLLGLGLGLWALSETNFSFPYARARLVGRGPVTVWEWGNFDGVHYLQIAERGYVDEFSQALFPVYPLVARGVAGIFGWDTLVAGLAVSNVSLVAGLGVWAKWATEYLGLRSESLPRLMWYVVLFPASFFFGAMYTESVFLLLSGWCIYAAYKKEWWWAGVAGGLASATRLVGIFLLPAAVLIWRQQGGRRQEREWRGWVKGWLRLPKPVGLIALGLVAYMVYLWISVGDPIYFVHVQPDFSAHRSVSELAWLPQVVWRYMKMLVTVPVKSTAYFTLVLELVTGVMFGADLEALGSRPGVLRGCELFVADFDREFFIAAAICDSVDSLFCGFDRVGGEELGGEVVIPGLGTSGVDDSDYVLHPGSVGGVRGNFNCEGGDDENKPEDEGDEA